PARRRPAGHRPGDQEHGRAVAPHVRRRGRAARGDRGRRLRDRLRRVRRGVRRRRRGGGRGAGGPGRAGLSADSRSDRGRAAPGDRTVSIDAVSVSTVTIGAGSVNLVGTALAAAAGLVAGAVGAAVGTPVRIRVPLVGVLSALLGVAGMVAGGAALSGHTFSVHLPNLLPLAGVSLDVDALSGVFLAVTGAVVVAASIYGIG